MIISSEPIGSTSLLQLVGLDQRPSPASPSQIPLGQTFTGWFPVIAPLITPVQTLFIVPMGLLMVPELLIVTKLLMVPSLLKVPKLLMVPKLLLVPELLWVP